MEEGITLYVVGMHCPGACSNLSASSITDQPQSDRDMESLRRGYDHRYVLRLLVFVPFALVRLYRNRSLVS